MNTTKTTTKKPNEVSAQLIDLNDATVLRRKLSDLVSKYEAYEREAVRHLQWVRTNFGDSKEQGRFLSVGALSAEIAEDLRDILQ